MTEDIIQSLGIDTDSLRFGIIGYPLKHTLSPRMHNALFNYYNINAFYFPFEIELSIFDKIAPVLRNLFAGFNITVPYKEKIINYLDETCDASKIIGACNTVYYKDNVWCGANTDWIGFTDSLEKDYNVTLRDKHVLILGAGGSARALYYGVINKGVKSVTVANRTITKALDIVDSIEALNIETNGIGINQKQLSMVSEYADIIINTTSIGLNAHDQHFFNFDNVKSDTFVYDLIYSDMTDFLIRADLKGLKIGNGKGMLVRQGSYAFEIWTKIAPDLKIMFDALKKL